MKTVLVVDDEPRIVRIVQDYLQYAGFAVLVAAEGAGALALARARRPDLVVLDLGLPGMDGLEVAAQLRRESQVPLIMLTARAQEGDRLAGLDLGADDYVTKPFSPRELVARVRAVLRRAEAGAVEDEVLRRGDLTFDLGKMTITRGTEPLELTPTEFQLIAALARRPGRVFTRSQLLDAVRGTAVESYERAIDAHVKNIRRKLEPDSRRPRYILTVYGAGYKFTDA
jgi:DNA-binding response OmpR family regulator